MRCNALIIIRWYMRESKRFKRESNYGEKLLPLHLITNHYITNDKKNRNPIIPNGKSMSGNKRN